MRKIIVTTFMTMDGILQAPGGPEEVERGSFVPDKVSEAELARREKWSRD